MALEYYTDFYFTAFLGFIPKLMMYMNEKGFDEINNRGIFCLESS